jgi:hypothetical protein
MNYEFTRKIMSTGTSKKWVHLLEISAARMDFKFEKFLKDIL